MIPAQGIDLILIILESPVHADSYVYTTKILPAMVDLVTMFSKLIISSFDMELDCDGTKKGWMRITDIKTEIPVLMDACMD